MDFSWRRPGTGRLLEWKLARWANRVKNFREGCFGSDTGIKSIEWAGEDCVAGAERDLDFMRSGRSEAAGWRDEVVPGCGRCARAAAGGRLLANGRCCRNYETASDAGDRVGAL